MSYSLFFILGDVFDIKQKCSLKDSLEEENKICQSLLKIINEKSEIAYNPNRTQLSFENIFSYMSIANRTTEYKNFMLELSKEFPNILFIFYCQYSGSLEMRIEAYLNEKVQEEKVELWHFSSNIEKLKEEAIKETENVKE